MDILLFIALFAPIFVKGDSVSGCPPPDPNCHPSDIVYDAPCRYCRTSTSFMSSGSSGSSSSWTTGSGSSSGGGSGSSSWDNSFGTSDWATAVNSEKDAFSSFGVSGSGTSGSGGSFSSSNGNSFGGNGFSSGTSSNSGGHSETTKYVIIEKQPEHTYTENIYPDIHPGTSSLLPSSIPGSGSPFSIPSNMGPGPSGMGPGSIPSFSRASVSSGSLDYATSSSHGRVVHVPLLAPGIPKYCVRGRILSCPSTCEKMDEWGCKSCPCAPARFQTMPVLMGGSGTHTVECAATKLCQRVCENGYTLGDVGHDGCRKCTCKATSAPSNKEPSCPETLKCMLKCKDGYFLGDKQSNGCPYCRCLKPHESEGHSGSSHGHSSGDSQTSNGQNPKNGWNLQGQMKDNSGSSAWTGSGSNSWTGSGTGGKLSGSESSGSSSILQSKNGIGSGDCKPPLCFDANMSEKDAMEMGKASAGGGFNHAGLGGVGGSSSPGTSGSGSGDDGCTAPMCFGGGQTLGSLSGGSTGSSGGCSGPFCASGNGMGMGGGMGSGSGSGKGTGGMPFSPFSSALSGGGPSLSGSSALTGSSGLTGSFTLTGSSSSSVTSGGSSALSGVSSAQVTAQMNCPGLFHCLVTCDGNYSLGPLDSAGCQTCSCS